jgi:predicted DNA-binding ribbon-helix-helix protein
MSITLPIRFGLLRRLRIPEGASVMKKSQVVKRSIVLAGHKTSISLEEPFWKALKDIAWRQHQTLSELIGGIDGERKYGNLSSAVRLFVLNHYQERSASDRVTPSDDHLAPLPH